MAFALKKRSVLPGFGLALGWTLFYLCLMVLIPLSTIFVKSASLSWAQFWSAVSSPRALASYRLSFGASLVAALIDGVFGLLVAWILVRYRFPFRRLVDGLVDLPFALPTAVAGIALTTMYSQNGWVGSRVDKIGIKVAYTPLGVMVALTFIGLPFVVRSVQPVLQDLTRCGHRRGGVRIMKGRPFEGMVGLVVLATELTAQRSTHEQHQVYRYGPAFGDHQRRCG